jgi:hypothetical protein
MVDTMFLGKDEILVYIDKNLATDLSEAVLNEMPPLRSLKKSTIRK